MVQMVKNAGSTYRPERPKGAKDEINGPEGPPARSLGPEGPKNSSINIMTPGARSTLYVRQLVVVLVEGC